MKPKSTNPLNKLTNEPRSSTVEQKFETLYATQEEISHAITRLEDAIKLTTISAPPAGIGAIDSLPAVPEATSFITEQLNSRISQAQQLVERLNDLTNRVIR